MKFEAVNCECGSADHVMLVAERSFDDDEVYVCVQMNTYLPWYRRVVQAVRYVLGVGETKYHWAETILGPQERKQLVALLTAHSAV